LGAGGSLGSSIRYCFKKGGIFSTLNTHHQLLFSSARIESCKDLVKEIDTYRPETIINCIALIDSELCEADKKLAMLVNSDIPSELARLTNLNDIRLIHVSSDAVLGYHKGVKCRDSIPSPENYYGLSKYQGEQAVLMNDPRAAIARVNFFNFSPKQNSYLDYFYQNGSRRLPSRGFTNILFNPLSSWDCGKYLVRLAMTEYSGIIHLANNESCTRLEFGKMVYRELGVDEDLVFPDERKDTKYGFQDMRLCTCTTSGLLDTNYDWRQSLSLMVRARIKNSFFMS
jgi:dTDP-4-dehydrorhamnose reductase